jgi:GH25 family lysozyme M1 (1,4-beta-N-acetylmuramidase)
MRLPLLLPLLPLLACAGSTDSQTRHAKPPKPTADTDTDADADTDTDTDADTDTDTDTDPWAADDNTVNPVEGIDVSHWNGDIDWSRVAADGIVFAISKCTESDYYTDDTFPDSQAGARGEGIIFGGYHFASPDDSSGAEQATFFVENGGGWQPDGLTLPGVLDIEYNPYGDTCYNLSRSEMEDWVADFSDTYTALTGRPPAIYTNADWWNTCVGDSAMPGVNPLWVAYWGSGTPTLPTGWTTYDLWQYSSEGSVDGVSGDLDVNRFPGTMHDLRMFANDTE